MANPFRHIIIELDWPLCKCPRDKLKWTPYHFVIEKSEKDKEKEPAIRYGLQVWCEKCGRKIIIEPSGFKAFFRITNSEASQNKKSSSAKLPEFSVGDRRFLKYLRMPLLEDWEHNEESEDKNTKK